MKRKIVKKGNKKKIAEVKETYYYIPILETIQTQLDSKRFLETVIAGEKQSCDANILHDFCDGTYMLEHPLFSCDISALKILLYYDDVNVVNPKNNKVHSLGFFYYQLANLPPEYRSKLRSIQLFAVCKKQYIKKYGLDPILEPFVEEL